MPPPLSRLRRRDIALVGVGGTFGTGARYLLTEVIPSWQSLPVATLAINVLGALLLGVPLERLALGGVDVGFRKLVGLLAGTGFLGGFTTYSALAVDATVLAGAGRPGAALAYAVLTIVVGGIATGLGILAAGWRRRGSVR